jgi:hypothetical protein
MSNGNGSAVKPVLFVALVGTGAYLFWQHQEKIKAVAKKVVESDTVQHARIPRPDFIATIPREPDDLDAIDAFLCECIAGNKLPGLEDEEIIVEQLRTCTATKLYPDFPWPPIMGDNETVHQLWLLIEYRIRSLANTGDLESICTAKPLPEPIDLPGLQGSEA